MHKLLEIGVDGFLADTKKITESTEYSNKHAISVIHDIRSVINKFYQGKESDGACLIIAGDLDSTGKIIKSIGLGANLVGYETSLLIAKAGYYSEEFFDEAITAKKIYNHMMATKSELTGIPAALGYSDIHNMSPSDFRTSSLKASLQGDILIEGVNKTYKQIVEEILDNFLKERKILCDGKMRQKI